ncbi:MAG TPA: FAD synthetase family protein, partial [Bacillales bacterium]|nr:FAD synthetase family protein [Bacillales bacterium]
MEVYHLIHPHELRKEDLAPSVTAFGFFDGVHFGHQKVIHMAKTIAKEKGIQSSVMTFYPPPAVVLGKQKHPEYLTPTDHKRELIAGLGIDQLFILRFDQAVFNLTPQQFVDEYMVGLNVRHAVAGFDFTYGSDREGTAEMLAGHAQGRFGVTIVDKVEKHGEKVSSTKIRELLREGKVEDVPAYLGDYYEM